jgi:hypothetical protein
MLSTFIPGLEDLVDDGAAPAPTQPETISTVDAELEKAEDVQAATELGAMDAEGEKITNMTNVVSAKLDEMERMVAHIQKYGVDRSFLSLCNHDNILNQSFDLQLPSCEAFDVVGNPSSPISIAALEGLKEGISKAIAWLKEMWKKFVDWFTKKLKAIKDFFFGRRREQQIKAVDKAVKQFNDLAKENPEAVEKAAEEIKAEEEAKAKASSKPQQAPEVSIEELIKQRDELLNKFADAVQKDEKYIRELIRRDYDGNEAPAGDSDPNRVKADIGILLSRTFGSDGEDAELKRQYDQFIEVAKAFYADPDSVYGVDNRYFMGSLRHLVNTAGNINELDDTKRFDAYADSLADTLRLINSHVRLLELDKQNPSSDQDFIAKIRESIPRLQKLYVMYVDVISTVCKVSQTQRDNILKHVSEICYHAKNDTDYARNEYERIKNELGNKGSK